MSALVLNQTKTAIGAGNSASFGASGGVEPYTYTVRPNGAGGTIGSSSGTYTAPGAVPSNPAQLYDTIQVFDSTTPTPLTVSAKILVGTPLLLFCDILQQFFGLPNGRVYLWDQKIMQPTDNGIYIAVSVLRCKPFGNTNKSASVYEGGLNQAQSVNMWAELQVDIISRDSSARDQKESVILALNSTYSQQQQEANGFYLGKLPPGSQFVNLSNPDGAAIPYRFAISVAMQYFYTLTSDVDYFDDFSSVEETVEP